jgi:hypothetical protein
VETPPGVLHGAALRHHFGFRGLERRHRAPGDLDDAIALSWDQQQRQLGPIPK